MELEHENPLLHELNEVVWFVLKELLQHLEAFMETFSL